MPSVRAYRAAKVARADVAYDMEMSDPPPSRIDLDHDSDLREWAESLGITDEQLRDAVEDINNAADEHRQTRMKGSFEWPGWSKHLPAIRNGALVRLRF